MSGQQITVNIRNLAYGGDGVGEVTSQADGGEQLLGITAFVPFTSVGEVVSARVVEKKDRYLKAQLLEVKNKAENRVEPECEYYQVCGGCELQHINYEAQLKLKKEMLVGALRVSGFPSKTLEAISDVVPSSPFNYRRRISLHLDQSGRAGFYRNQTRSVVPINSCSIATKGINKILENLQECASELSGMVSSIALEEDAEGIIAVLQSTYAVGDIEKKEIFKVAKKYFEDASLVAEGKEIAGFGRQILEYPIQEDGLHLRLRVPAGSFSQVNAGINLALIKAVLKEGQIKPGSKVCDLYSGAGNFSLPLAYRGASIVAVEAEPRLVSYGRDSASQYSFSKKIKFIESTVEKYLKKKEKSQTFDLILADPPRSGLGQVASELKFANNLLLISCQQPSFVRDARNLTNAGWELEKVIPFDMFAQTSQLEILSVYRRGGA